MATSAPTKQKGLRFVSGAKMRSVTYTIRPAVPERDPLTGRQVGLIPPLRAVFKEHRFSSKTSQESQGWSDEERIAVEKYLLNHSDFGRSDGRGIHLDKSTTIPQVIPDYLLDQHNENEAVARKTHAEVPQYSGERCEFIEESGDVSVQCPDEATDGGFCEKHAGIVAAAGVGE